MHRYVRRNKTDRTEAKALLEAHRNEEIHPVPVKSVDQQALTALHRLRATWLAARTARINTLRGVLREFGVVIPIGTHHVVPVLRQLAEHPRVPTALHAIAQAAADEIVWLERALHDLEHRLEALATQLPDVDLLRTIPGVGSSRRPRWSPVWAVRDACPRAGILPVTLGLTAREDSSAQHRHLGDQQAGQHLRAHAHSRRPVSALERQGEAHPDHLRAWALRTEQRRGHNVAAVTVANKLARIAWAVWTRQVPYVVATDTPQPDSFDSTRRSHTGRTGAGTPR